MKERVTMPICFLALLCLFACQSKQSIENLPDQGPSVYTIDLNAKSVGFLDQIESISIFSFEETSESLLSMNSFFFDYEDGVIVVQEGEGTVFVFDKQGSFVSKFERKGDGPEEYKSMQNTVYRDGFIETYDMQKQRLVRYSLEGDFLSELKLPYRAMHVLHEDDKYLLSMGNKSEGDSANYNLIILDEEAQVLSKGLPIDKPVPFPIATGINEFKRVDDQVVFNALLTDSLMLIDGLEAKPFIKFDFGDDWFWTEEMYADGGKAMSAISQAVEEDGKVWIYTWAIGPNRIEMSYNTSFSNSRNGYVDRATGEFHHYDYGGWGDGKPQIRVVRFEGDELLLMMTSDTLDPLVQKLGEDKYRVLGGVSLERIMESENPVMVWVKFK
ncbi:MAG: hypothetical protein ACJAVN_000689 [Roseivirga sp.]|jgi:hypothetical protein